MFKIWITESTTLALLTKLKGTEVSVETLRRHFDKFLDNSPHPQLLLKKQGIYLKVDGKYFKHWGCILAFKERDKIIFWDFVSRESYSNYLNSLLELNKSGYFPLGITSDWHGSIVEVVKTLYPNIPHQRCLVHTQRFCQSFLTKQPKTEAGERLLSLVQFLNHIKSHYEKNIWLKWLIRFENIYQQELKQRTYAQDGKHWWYTHKNLRRVFRSLKNSTTNLFLYLDFKGLSKDTNGLEAEFKHLKQKLSVHKGLTRKRRINFTKWYLYFRSVKS